MFFVSKTGKVRRIAGKFILRESSIVSDSLRHSSFVRQSHSHSLVHSLPKQQHHHHHITSKQRIRSEANRSKKKQKQKKESEERGEEEKTKQKKLVPLSSYLFSHVDSLILSAQHYVVAASVIDACLGRGGVHWRARQQDPQPQGRVGLRLQLHCRRGVVCVCVCARVHVRACVRALVRLCAGACKRSCSPIILLVDSDLTVGVAFVASLPLCLSASSSLPLCLCVCLFSSFPLFSLFSSFPLFVLFAALPLAVTPQVAKDLDLSGKVALVTGANSGLGLETATILAWRGAHVVVAARTKVKVHSRACCVLRAACFVIRACCVLRASCVCACVFNVPSPVFGNPSPPFVHGWLNVVCVCVCVVCVYVACTCFWYPRSG